MTNVSVVVYHNEDGRLWSYTPGDRLTEVARFELPMIGIEPVEWDAQMQRVAERVWIGLNFVGEMPNQPWARRYFGWTEDGSSRDMSQTHRSLCTGDVIVLGETAWVVSSFGFEQIALPRQDESV